MKVTDLNRLEKRHASLFCQRMSLTFFFIEHSFPYPVTNIFFILFMDQSHSGLDA